MIELKEWTASEIEEYDDARLELAEDGNIYCTRVYIKQDVDKVIEELRNEANVYKAKYEQEYDIAVHNEKQLSVMRIEIRHHKYKRCLDKAELCELRYYRTKDLHRTKDIEDKYYMGSPLFKKRLFKLWFYEKWTNKWLELAEQFKEGV